MDDKATNDEYGEMHISWKRFFVFAGFVKAVVAGAGLGLALLGVFDIALSVSAYQWWNSLAVGENALNWFALLGGFLGCLLHVARRYHH